MTAWRWFLAAGVPVYVLFAVIAWPPIAVGAAICLFGLWVEWKGNR